MLIKQQTLTIIKLQKNKITIELYNEYMSKKERDSNASASSCGYDFQACAGIYLFFNDIKENKDIKIEGNNEDIEINRDTGNVYAQAKSYSDLGDDPNAKEKLKKALKTLHKAYENDKKAIELIYITNFLKPIGNKTKSTLAFERVYNYDMLSEEDKQVLLGLDSDFPFEKFKILAINFMGEGETKYKSIIDKISDFLVDADVNYAYRKQVFNALHTLMHSNADDKPLSNGSNRINKKRIINKIFVIIEEGTKDEVFERLEINDIETINNKYNDLIEKEIPNFELTGSIIGHFIGKRNEDFSKKEEQIIDYINNYHEDYMKEFDCVKNIEDRKAVTKYIIYKVLKNRSIYSKLKEATDL